jgi:transcriptional regulator with XRE-family HTH domain
MDDAITLSGRLVALRGTRSVRSVASGTGMSKTTYERRELDPTNLTYREMRLLARFYGITVAELVEPADGEPVDAPAWAAAS